LGYTLRAVRGICSLCCLSSYLTVGFERVLQKRFNSSKVVEFFVRKSRGGNYAPQSSLGNSIGVLDQTLLLSWALLLLQQFFFQEKVNMLTG